MRTTPSAIPMVTGESCGRPSARVVMRMPWWRGATNASIPARSTVVAVATVGTSPSGRELGREHVDRLDVGRRREQLVGAFHQCGGDRAAEVGLAAVVVGEDVEDPERGVAELDREPRGGRGLLLGQRERRG